MMIARKSILCILLVASMRLTSLSQAPTSAVMPADDEARLPALYEFYFYHLETIDAISAKAIAEGRDISHWKDRAQVQTGMPDGQWTAFHDVAIKYLQDSRALNEKFSKILAQVANAHRTGVGDQHPQALDQLLEERTELLANAIASFRMRADETSYQSMNAFLLKNIQTIPAAAAPAVPVPTGGDSAKPSTTQTASSPEEAR